MRYCTKIENAVGGLLKEALKKAADVMLLKSRKKLLYGIQAAMQPYNPHSSVTAVDTGVLRGRTCSSHGIWRSLQQPHQWRNAVRGQHGSLVAIIAATQLCKCPCSALHRRRLMRDVSCLWSC